MRNNYAVSQPNELRCPSCGSPFRLEDYDPGKGVLSCSYCKALMTLGAPTDSQPKPPAQRAEVPLPPGVVLQKTRDGVELRRRWFRAHFVFLAFFCLVWNSFLLFWYSLALSDGAPWIMVVFPLLHVAVGVGLTYWTLAGLLNTTTIRVERRSVVVRHAPIPWRGPGAIEKQSIDQLYVKPTQHRGKHGISWTYAVWVVARDKASFQLVAGLSEPDVALFIEQSIERALGLKDRSVPGELARDSS